MAERPGRSDWRRLPLPQSKIDWQQGGTIERKDPSSGGFLSSKKWIAGGLTVPGPLDWAATADQYFAIAFLPDNPQRHDAGHAELAG